MFLAWREIRRSKGRFALLGGAVGLLVYVLLFFQAIAGALLSGLTGAVEQADADVLVYADQARLDLQASVLPAEVAGEVAAVDGVAAVAPVGQSVFTAEAAGEEVEAVLFGVDDDALFWPASRSDGRLPEADGEVLASAPGEEGFSVGDRVVIQPGDVEVEVVGIADGAQLNVLPTLYGTFGTYAEAVRGRAPGIPEVPASILAVAVADGEDPAAVAARIEGAVDGVEARDRDAAVDALPATGQITGSFSILEGLLIVVVTIVTGVFFLILTVQKRDALVLLRAVGGRRSDLVVPVLLQVVVVVGGGLAVGAALAAGTLAGLGGLLGATLPARTVATTGALVLGLGLLAALGAVRRILAIDPVEATGQEAG
jgi:putative ABC transport system permease protein